MAATQLQQKINGSDKMMDNYFDQLIRDELTNGKDIVTDCFNHFDEDRDGALNIPEFHKLCRHLVSCTDDDVAVDPEWSQQDTEDIMRVFSDNGTQMLIDDRIFQNCWTTWMHPILAPKCALMIVDVQNDFISGSLALKNGPAQQEGEKVVPVVNSLLNTVLFDEVIYSKDWHPANHISFFDNLHLRNMHLRSTSKITEEASEVKVFDKVTFDIDYKPVEQILWPVHCVQNSQGAELHRDLKIVSTHLEALKGTNPERDNYSVLYTEPEPNNSTSGHTLAGTLRQKGITDLFVCGLAYDFCVGKTALDARSLGFRAVVIEDACSGFAEDSINKMSRDLKEAGCVSVTADQVSSMVSGRYRNPMLAKVAAVDVCTRGEAST